MNIDCIKKRSVKCYMKSVLIKMILGGLPWWCSG